MFYAIMITVFILLAIAGGFYIPRIMKKREYLKYDKLRPKLLSTIRGYGVDIKPEDIRIKVKDKRRVEYILDVYKGRDVVLVKSIEKSLQRMLSDKYPKHRMSITTDFKKNGRRNF